MTNLHLVRVEGWEDRLYDTIESWRDKVFDYAAGANCFFFAMDCVKAVTETDPYEDERGLITEEEDVKARLSAWGFDDIEGAIASIFQPIPPSLAWRGDLGIVDEEFTRGEGVGLAVFNGSEAGAIAMGPRLLVPVSVRHISRAYKVGH